jgi:hypothetical protein
MTKGLGRIPAIRGTLTQDRDEPGNDMPAGRNTPAPRRTAHAANRTAHAAKETSGQGARAGSASARQSPGLAPGALGWPWHPRRLATAQHRGHQGAQSS